jgi:hypothetical protein
VFCFGAVLDERRDAVAKSRFSISNMLGGLESQHTAHTRIDGLLPVKMAWHLGLYRRLCACLRW